MVLGPRVQFSEQGQNHNGLSFLGNVLRMPTERLPHCAAFFEAANGRRIIWVTQRMTWVKSAKI